MAWIYLADNKLTGTSDTVDSGEFTAKNFLMFQAWTTGANTELQFQLNSDTDPNYASMRDNDGSTGNFINQSMSKCNASGGGASTFAYMLGYINNYASEEKQIITFMVADTGTGSGTAPRCAETVTKWVNTADQVISIQLINNSTGDFAVDSEIVVYGSD